jgi:chromosome segregation ATPase
MPLTYVSIDVDMLHKEIDTLICTHQEELKMLQQTLSSKQKTIHESESNMTAIGTYVDKLEERLTSFAMTRRDIEARERKCKEIEEAAVASESEKKDLEVKVDKYSKEQEELKKLLEELALERTSLQKNNRKLATDSEFRIAEQEQLQTKCSSLECEVKELSEALNDLRSQYNILTPALEAAEQSNLELQGSVENAVELENQLGKVQSENTDLQEELRLLKEENVRLEGQVVNVTGFFNGLEEKTKKEKQQMEERMDHPFAASLRPRHVPFRAVRKKFAQATGIHGAITPSSAMLKENSFRGKQSPFPVPGNAELAPPSNNQRRQSSNIFDAQSPNAPPLPP